MNESVTTIRTTQTSIMVEETFEQIQRLIEEAENNNRKFITIHDHIDRTPMMICINSITIVSQIADDGFIE